MLLCGTHSSQTSTTIFQPGSVVKYSCLVVEYPELRRATSVVCQPKRRDNWHFSSWNRAVSTRDPSKWAHPESRSFRVQSGGQTSQVCAHVCECSRICPSLISFWWSERQKDSVKVPSGWKCTGSVQTCRHYLVNSEWGVCYCGESLFAYTVSF